MMISFLLKVINSNKNVIIDYSHYNSVPLIILKSSDYQIQLVVNTFIFATISNDFFEHETIKTDIYENKTIEEAKGNFTLINNPSIKLSNYSLYYGQIFFIPHLGLSLAYKFKDESYSFVHKLYHDNYIDYKAFTFNYYNQIIFGEHIEKIPFKYKGQFDIDKSYSHWGANISGINYRGYHYDFNTHFIVHSGYYQMIVSNQIFDFMTKVIFADEIELNNCVIENSFNEKHLNCYNVGIEGFTNITLQIGKMSIVLKREDLFVKKFLWESKFMYNPYNNYTFLGYDFIHLMNQTVFDYEKGTITFYSDEVIIEMDTTNYTVIKSIILLNLLLCLCINALLIYIKFYIVNKN